MSIQRNIEHQFYATIPNVQPGVIGVVQAPESPCAAPDSIAGIRSRIGLYLALQRRCAGLRRRQMRGR